MIFFDQWENLNGQRFEIIYSSDILERRQLAKARIGHIMIGDKKAHVFGLFGLKSFSN